RLASSSCRLPAPAASSSPRPGSTASGLHGVVSAVRAAASRLSRRLLDAGLPGRRRLPLASFLAGHRRLGQGEEKQRAPLILPCLRSRYAISVWLL
ncbi:unnamed protein product, partial [Urochloa humidicola]